MEFKDSVFHDILKNEIARVRIGAQDIRSHFASISGFIAAIPSDKKDFAYAPGKWTVAQVLGHIIDAQVVFLYRILNISRGDKVRLPGFDEGIWVENGITISVEEVITYMFAHETHHATILKLRYLSQV